MNNNNDKAIGDIFKNLSSLNDNAGVDNKQTTANDNGDNAEGDEKVIIRKVVKDDGSDSMRVVRKGKVVTLTPKQIANKRKVHGGLSPAQYMARIKGLRKARLKSNTAGAKMKRAKSLAIRKSRIGDSLNIDTLADTLRISIQEHLTSEFQLDETQIEKIQEILCDGNNCEVVKDGKNIIITLPTWKESNDGLDVESYELKDFSFSIDDNSTDEDITNSLLDDHAILDEVIITEK